MISFELDSSKTGIQLFVDSVGVAELIEYLKYIERKDNHFHLIAGNELNERVVNSDNESIKCVEIVFL